MCARALYSFRKCHGIAHPTMFAPLQWPTVTVPSDGAVGCRRWSILSDWKVHHGQPTEKLTMALRCSVNQPGAWQSPASLPGSTQPSVVTLMEMSWVMEYEEHDLEVTKTRLQWAWQTPLTKPFSPPQHSIDNRWGVLTSLAKHAKR